MDNYQLNLINRGKFAFESNNGSERFVFDNGFVLYQNENYKITGYKLVIDNSVVDHVCYLEKEYASKSGRIEVAIDFSINASTLTISFKNGLADDCIIPIQYILADHGKFDEKEARANKEQLANNVALVVAKGNSLINVYFKKANSKVEKSIVRIDYYGENDEYYTLDESENEAGFKSISGLAYGKYKCVVSQFDSKNNLIISVEKMVVLNDEIDDLKKVLKNSLEDVKKQVGASSKHTVSW